MDSIKQKIKGLLHQKLLKSFGVYTVAKVINSSIPFLMLPIMTAYLSPTDYGTISMMTTIAAFVFPFISLNTHSAILRRFYYKNDNIAQYIGCCIKMVMLSMFIVTVSFSIFSTPLSSFSAVPKLVLFFIPLYSFFCYFKEIVLFYWQVNGKSIKYGIYSVTATTVELLLAVLLIVVLGFNWTGRAISIFFTAFIFAIISYTVLKRSGLIEYTWSKEKAQHALKYGIGLIPHAIGASLMTLANRFFITNMISIEETGLYGVANSMASLLSFVTLSFNNAFVPWLFAKLSTNDENEKVKIVRLTYLYMIILFIIGVCAYIFIATIFPVFINSNFHAATKYIPYLLIGFVFQGCYMMVTNYILFIEKTHYLASITIVTGIISLFLNYLLIRKYAAIGASYAFAMTYIIYFFITWIVAARTYKMPWLEIFK